MNRKRIPSMLISSGAAGAIALVIYVIIAAATAKNANVTGLSIVVGGVLLGLFTFVVAFIINVIISSIFARRRE